MVQPFLLSEIFYKNLDQKQFYHSY